MLADLTAKELASLWESEQPNPAPPPPATTPPASSLDPIGSNTGLSGTTGASAGPIPRLVHAVADKQALEAADGLSRRKRRTRPSLALVWRPDSRTGPNPHAAECPVGKERGESGRHLWRQK